MSVRVFYVFGISENSLSHFLLVKQRRRRQILTNVVGSVLAHLYFFYYYSLFALQFVLRNCGVEIHIRQNIHTYSQIVRRTFCVKASGVLGCIGVDICAQIVYFFGNLQARAALRSLENQMFYKVRVTVCLGCFAHAPHVYENAQRHCVVMLYLFRHKSQSAWVPLEELHNSPIFVLTGTISYPLSE